MFSLDNLSLIEFAGLDARQFLHNQLSSDVLAIDDGETGFACCCNPAGRVLGLLLLRRQGDDMLAICSRSLATELVNWFSRFIFRDKVRVSLREDLVVTPGQKSEALAISNWKSCAGVNYVVVPADDGIPGANTMQLARSRSAELVRGVCWLAPASSGQFLPQMLGFEKIGALSFSKGCYPGQEVIARTRYLGKLKRRAVLVRADATMEPALMAKLSLGTDNDSWSAVVVDSAPLEDDSTMILTVARKSDDIEPEWMELDGQRVPLLAD